MSARGTILPFERWRHDAKQNRDIVTVFEFSVLSRSVKTYVGPVTSIVEGPYAQYDRYIRIGLLRPKRNIIYCGHEWPCWIVVVEGDHSKVPFPGLPEDFDRWFSGWVAASGVKVIQDWRAEALRDGAADDWTWQETHRVAAAMRAGGLA